jgi:lipoprotein NlpI
VAGVAPDGPDRTDARGWLGIGLELQGGTPMRFSILSILSAASLALAGSAPVSPARADDVVDACAKGHGDARIAACANAIKSGRWRGRDIAWAYVNRGWAYEDKGDHDHAIADETEAIRLDPKNVSAYVNRGWAYDDMEDYDRAIADETEAIRLDPNNVAAYIYRGWAHDDKDQYDLAIADESEAIRIDPKRAVVYNNRGSAYVDKQDYARALGDFTQAIELAPKYTAPYRNRARVYLYTGKLANALADITQGNALDTKNAHGALWLDIIAQRNNVPSRLAETSAQLDMTAWPAPVIRMFLGQMTPAAVLAAADSPNAVVKNDHVCEANFYSGELALRSGAKDEAARLFRLAANGCPHGLDEWDAAKGELTAAGAGP